LATVGGLRIVVPVLANPGQRFAGPRFEVIVDIAEPAAGRRAFHLMYRTGHHGPCVLSVRCRVSADSESSPLRAATRLTDAGARPHRRQTGHGLLALTMALVDPGEWRYSPALQ
jgi:hypothetical protein